MCIKYENRGTVVRGLTLIGSEIQYGIIQQTSLFSEAVAAALISGRNGRLGAEISDNIECWLQRAGCLSSRQM